MNSFLKAVLEQIYYEQKSFNSLVFVLPSKRAGVFLKKHIAEYIDKPIFSPKIYSIEELITEISGLESAPKLDLLLTLYETFQPHLDKEENSFESFITWGSILLNDFNEIDRNLVNAESLFTYLTANQRLKSWGVELKDTPLLSKNLKFWNGLYPVYLNFKDNLKKKGVGYSGLLYSQALKNVNEYILKNTTNNFYFLGFNALNKIEEEVFNEFINHANSEIWWDLDPYFLKDDIHEAGYFIRHYLKKWPQSKTLSTTHSNFLKEKSISITGVPKSISQAKFSGNIIKSLTQKKGEQNIALVLSDEALLPSILNSLPENIDKINITMGLPLNKTSLYEFFDSLFDLHIKKSKTGWFYKDVIKVLSNPYCVGLLGEQNDTVNSELISSIKEKNILFIGEEFITQNSALLTGPLQPIFQSDLSSPKDFLRQCISLSLALKEQLRDSSSDKIHQLYAFFQLFNQLESILASKSYIKSLKTFKYLFGELVRLEKIDFKGEPLGGLQIMGVLESRNLDFENVILTSVNEGILPSGKNQNSFIPFDIRIEFDLPTYKEKDAIYAYHFYRLIQRPSNVHIIYNTEPDVLLGNEKSRFISQLLSDESIKSNVTHQIAAPKIQLSKTTPREIIKTTSLLTRLDDLSAQGFSPSSLSVYIKDPFTFYKRYILNIKDVDEVEESIAHNTFGTIIHDTLEELYTPLIGQNLTAINLNPLKNKVAQIARRHFEEFFFSKDLETGPNLIAFHVVEKYLSSFIEYDISRCQTNEIRLLGLEKSLKIQISDSSFRSPVFLKGKLDRIELCNGALHILDYKTGATKPSDVELIEIDKVLTNESKVKAFQLLCYALMVSKDTNHKSIMAGIAPLKNINSGILHFAKKESARGPKNHTIGQRLLEDFEKCLSALVNEIINPDIPFKEKT